MENSLTEQIKSIKEIIRDIEHTQKCLEDTLRNEKLLKEVKCEDNILEVYGHSSEVGELHNMKISHTAFAILVQDSKVRLEAELKEKSKNLSALNLILNGVPVNEIN